MKNINLLKLLVAAISAGLASCSSIYYADDLDCPNGRLNEKASYVSGWQNGIGPRAGSDTLRIKGGGVDNGMAEYTFDASIVPGVYLVTVDASNPANCPIAEGTRVRLTAVPTGAARGSILEPVREWHEDPVRGGIERWVYKFRVKHRSPHIGKQVGVVIWVPGMGKGRNISFDNLQVHSYPRLRARMGESN